jgi:hypothetical protein
MVKIVSFLLLVVAVGCGRSECADYCTVACDKSVACDAPPGTKAAGIDRGACVNTCVDGLEAARLTEAQCKDIRQSVAAMSCDQFRAFIANASR